VRQPTQTDIAALVEAVADREKRDAAEAKVISLTKILDAVGVLLNRIEQLPNVDHMERGPLAREAIALIEKSLKV
jgi:hypothetical protein